MTAGEVVSARGSRAYLRSARCGRIASLVLVSSSLPVAAAAQAFASDPTDAAIASSWELVRSTGQPPRWKPYFLVGFGVDGIPTGPGAGAALGAGVNRSIGNPVTGLFGLGAEGYVGQRGTRLDGGVKAQVTSPLLLVNAGADWNVRLGRADLMFGATVPLRRGGWPVAGSELRVDWIPARDHSAALNVTIPLGQPLAGRTRTRSTEALLPSPPRTAAPILAPLGEEARAALAESRVHMTQLVSLLTFFWLIENRHLRYSSTVREWRELLQDFSAEFLNGSGAAAEGTSAYEREAGAYHAALERAFAVTAGAGADRDARGRMLADAARRVGLVEVILPYNRTIGRYRTPNTLTGLTARARAEYAAWLALHTEIEPRQVPEVLAVLDSWLADLEALRARIGEIQSDPRFTWMPLGLVLRSEQHRTQAQIDEIVSLAMKRDFYGGNTAVTIDAPQFQHELRRTIREARSYHVLWIHDYRGRDDLGDPDRTGFITTMTYLRALRDAVQRYDSTGNVPAYMILLDQFFYEANDGRLWMTLLEQPLRHEVRLGTRFEWMERSLEAMQDSLREAVSASARLQARRAALGDAWMAGVVKVHVSITNPSDFSFRTQRILHMPVGADNWIRDHRKLILRDAAEDDPSAGELILSGVGVGDHYASATWDDRAIIIRGPAASATRAYLRRTLEQHGLSGSAMPAEIRARPVTLARQEQLDLMEADGATARVLQAHNEVGWGAKEATFVQMLLYDLAPPGTLIAVPDGLWSSYQWTAQLVGAALRGCHVYVVAPAARNAPANDFPWMSLMQELITRLTLVEEVLGEAIRAGGGDLRVGLYARETPLDDHAGSLASVEKAWEAHAFLRERVPLSHDALAVLSREAERRGALPMSDDLIQDVRARRPLLHRKTQWVFGANALREIASSPGLPQVLHRTVGGVVANGPTDSSAAESHLRLRGARDLVALHGELSAPSHESVLYFMTGSINKNVRSMMLDGEVLSVVAGPWALESLVDFMLLAASVTWVETLDDVERELPPYSQLRRLLGRLLHPIL